MVNTGEGLFNDAHMWSLNAPCVCSGTCVVAQRYTQGLVQQGNSRSVSLRKRGSEPSNGEETSRQKDMLSWLPGGRGQHHLRILKQNVSVLFRAPFVVTGYGQVPQRDIEQLLRQTGHPVRVSSRRPPPSVLHLVRLQHFPEFLMITRSVASSFLKFEAKRRLFTTSSGSNTSFCVNKFTFSHRFQNKTG